ncbi:mechanosensitive ion channel family protein [Firmicutes bacterium CAG:631]|nr:mechanosensitive ion channel family protein [Firmicutes bacterium CAG:631]
MFLAIDWKKILNDIIHWISTSGVKLLIGFIVLLIVFKMINIISKRIKRRLENKHVDRTIVEVTNSILRKGLKIIALIVFLGYVGIDTAAVGSIIGAIGVAIGLAVQGSLSNFAGGIVILVMRPFKLGDYIVAQDVEGTVEEIKTFYTTLVTADNKVVMLPNGTLANDIIINLTRKNIRRVDNSFQIAYQEDVEKAKKIMLEICEQQSLILKDPEVAIRLFYQESGIELSLRTWVKTDDYWDVYYYLNEAVKLAFDKHHIQLSYHRLSVQIENSKHEE